MNVLINKSRKMKKVLFVLVLALSISQLRADEPVKDNAVPKATTQIEGKVIDHLTGEALTGVTLKLSGSDAKTYSDLEGNFRFDGITTGTYDIEIDYVSYKDVTLKSVSTASSDVVIKVELESASRSL
jgi:hypothetical protein